MDDTDRELALNIRRALNALDGAVQSARNAGLTVEFDIYELSTVGGQVNRVIAKISREIK